MLSQTTIKQLASIDFADAYTDFVLSRQAMQCTKATLEFYRHTAAKFLEWAERQGVNVPQQVDAFLVRQYLAELAEKGKKDTTLHDHARAIRTLLKFWHAEGYLEKPVKLEERATRNAPQPAPVYNAETKPPVLRMKHASDYWDKILKILEEEYKKTGKVPSPKEITSRLKLEHSNNKGFVSTLTKEWRKENGISK